ncbi:pyridoxal phosphate-dependent aminotransferase [Silvibacterium dinghuense]|uniref:alanine transaminase n=1 Tax=Silvibacterium dinghuense TaxID=1560006 RepID=A0A4Q1SGK7_9BACT|nr:pyridoxal phosphate-dependent aminotransferase [Silvibacterium dinghuense]RXS96671.1 pyridoxal phosphate-dependent aminotransferase [Silvibacterium dinghuense]GGG92708.1 aminotransferase [Silvibacterium dinghuense]
MSVVPSFSSRTGWNTEETDLARALRERRMAGLPLFDLTASNPTHCGFEYDAEAILAPLRESRALDYDPDPRGMQTAREAVVRYYAEQGSPLPAEHVLLTTSTSEAYSYLFRLLADPGDEILIAQPSYPLFDFLVQLEDVRLVPYALFYDHGWHLDPESLRRRIGPRTRAIALVHPNNPTGHFTKASEREALEQLCAEHGLALIVDEVFLDYSIESFPAVSFAAGEHPVLTFVLSGLSKVAGLPQMKASWIAAFGPQPVLDAALKRLEVIADTFLAMNAPVQCALPAWLENRVAIQQQIRLRLRENLNLLDAALARQVMVSRLELEAGWYAVLRIPALVPDEDFALRMVLEHGVSVHPGSSFGFAGSGWLVVSLLAPPHEFASGMESLLGVFRGN